MASQDADSDGNDLSDYLRAFSVAFGLVVAGFLVANIVAAPLITVLSTLDISMRSTIGYTASTLLQNIAFVAVVIAYARYAGLLSLLDIRWSPLSNPGRTMRDIGWAIIGFVVLFAVSQAVGIALQQFGFAPGTNRVETAARAHPTLALSLIVLSFVATGPGEEILFRGGVQGILRRTFSPISAVLLSSALFGLAHVTSVVAASGAGGVWGYIVSAFLLGLVLGGLYEYTGNLLIPIVVHGAYNAVLFAQLYISETQNALGF